MENDCLFCKIINGDISCHKIAENDNFVAFLDIQPINKGHTLVVPKKHFKDVFDFPEYLESKYMDFLKKVVYAVKKGVNADGINIGMNNGEHAGQVIFHQHTHIIPRYKGDGLKSWSNKEMSQEELIKVKEDIEKEL